MSTTPSSISSEFSHKNVENGNVEIEWNKLGFELMPTDYMYVMKCCKDEEFTEGQLIPFGDISLSPAAGVLNYGQGLFEGIKAMRREDGRIVIYRPDENALRMIDGADRLCMPCPSVDQFIEAVKITALANKRWIPPYGKGSLYIRPLLLGTGPILGLNPASEYTFLIYVTPVRNYFKEGQALNLLVEDQFDRASRGGVGGVKSITNYAPTFKPLAKARSKGFSDVLYLDSVSGEYVEEASSCNVFMVKNKTISTPPKKGTILPGVTRKSIIEIAIEYGYNVEVRQISLDELLEADEVFCTGTAVVVVPVGSITYKDKRVEFHETGANSVCKRMWSAYVGIQMGHIEDKKGWIVEIN